MATKQRRVNKSVGERIRELRIGLEMSQATLAKKIGSHQSEVSEWEQGLHEPQLVTLLKIAKALGVEIGNLFPS